MDANGRLANSRVELLRLTYRRQPGIVDKRPIAAERHDLILKFLTAWVQYDVPFRRMPRSCYQKPTG